MAVMVPQDKEKPGLLARYLPILHWLPHYNKAWLTGDIVACLSVWAVMVPQSLGYAAISWCSSPDPPHPISQCLADGLAPRFFITSVKTLIAKPIRVCSSFASTAP